MKIVIDENIPQAKDAFENFGKIILLNGRKITNEILSDAEILLVRSITKVDESLLNNTQIKFVATATAGTDHVDKDYLSSRKIVFTDAAGCNSYSVAEYFISAILNISYKLKLSLENKSIGVVGIGNVGSKVVRFAKELGLNVFMNDPPLQRANGKNGFVDLKEILNCDIITLHVPLNMAGIDKTFHLIDEREISDLKPGTILINTSRGEVVNNQALKKRLMERRDLITVFDVWENEPLIDFSLLELVSYGSAHIAGYSLEGKVNGTEIIYNKLCNYLNISPAWKPKYPQIEKETIEFNNNGELCQNLLKTTNSIYDIEFDDGLLRDGINKNFEVQSKHFDLLRKNYRIRREFNNYYLKLKSPTEELINKLKTFRFNVFNS